MKTFLDRIAWHSHRPTIYNKPAVLISTTAGMGTSPAIKQLSWISLLGFRILAAKGFLKYPGKASRPKYQKKTDQSIIRLGFLLLKNLSRIKKSSPSLLRVIQFNALKINASTAPDIYKADAAYYKNRIFFNNISIHPLKRALGNLFFKIGCKSLRSKFKIDQPSA